MLIQNTAAHHDFLHRAYFEWLLENGGPKTDDELRDVCSIYYGFNLPTKTYCTHHVPPFMFIADQFFDRAQTVFGFANRSGGKTRAVAVLNGLDMYFKPGVEICSAGAIQEQANRGYEYLVEMLERSPLDRYVTRYNREGLQLSNGSKARIIVATYHGLNSPHPQRFRVDEIELIHPALLQEAFSMSQAKGDFKAQDTLTSTRKFASGTVQKLLNEQEQRRVKVMPWCIWETVERCERRCKNDPVYGDCPIYSRINKDGKEEMLCGIETPAGAEPDGHAHHVPGGWYRLEDVVKKGSLLNPETFRTQWLNEKPHAGRLIYGKYFKDEEPHVVMEAAEMARILELARENKWMRVYALDFGSNFACTMWMHDPHDDIWYCYAEYFYSSETDLALKEHGENLKLADPLGYHGRIPVFGDPQGRQAMRDLQDVGIFASPANNDVYAGINHCKDLFKMKHRPSGGVLPGLRVFKTCKRLRKELGELYMHAIDKNGEVNYDVIVKKDDHAADTMRYGLYSFVTIGTGRYKTRKLRGVF